MYKISKNVASIKLDSLQFLSEKNNLSKNDYRVLIFLLCRLDSLSYRKIDKQQISDTLNMKKKKVDESIQHLVDEFILDEGSDEHVKKGYKFSL